ncbi:transposase [Actinacidiphila sp. bgisy160]|uniref:transposase n=1 Tax=Actinacidiphila sp. bgisy160 TaxID=3413796 RepID=UPI003D743603
MTAPNPDIVRIPRPDFADIRRQAADEVAAELDALAADLTRRGHRAGQIVHQADAAMASLRPRRDAALLSLWAYERTRGVWKSSGVTEQAVVKITRAALGLADGEDVPAPGPERAAAAKAAGIAHMPTAKAIKQLIDLAEKTETARARREVALKVRNDAVKTLLGPEYGWTRDQVMVVLGLNSYSRITDIVGATRTPAADKELRQRAVAEVLGGRARKDVAEEYGVPSATLGTWIARAKKATA